MSDKGLPDEVNSSSNQSTSLDRVFAVISKVDGRQLDDVDFRSINRWFADSFNFDKYVTPFDVLSAFTEVAKDNKRINKDEFRQIVIILAEEKDESSIARWAAVAGLISAEDTSMPRNDKQRRGLLVEITKSPSEIIQAYGEKCCIVLNAQNCTFNFR